MPDANYSDVYFGNSPQTETREGVEYLIFKTHLPGTEPEHACGDDDLVLPADHFYAPELIGPGCDPTVDRYAMIRKQPEIAFGTRLFTISRREKLAYLRPDIVNEEQPEAHWLAQVAGQAFVPSPDNKWYFLTPDGDLYRWNGGAQDQPLGTLVAFVGRDVFEDPKRLLLPPVGA